MGKLGIFVCILQATLIQYAYGADNNSRAELSHGYIAYPRSRAYLCYLRENVNCGAIQYEPQSVEGPKGFPESGPPDGKIASGAVQRFRQLDEYGKGRWKVKTAHFCSYNASHASLKISWTLTAAHRTTNFKTYISNKKYVVTEPLRREFLILTPVCTVDYHSKLPPRKPVQVCYFKRSDLKVMRNKPGLMLGVWTIADTTKAFYQVVDFKSSVTENCEDGAK